MKYNIDTIKEIVSRNSETPIIYFWVHTSNEKKMTAACLSQWMVYVTTPPSSI